MKKYFLSFLFSFMALTILADEGMWLPLLLEKQNIKRMQELGCKLSAEDIYSVNHSSLKDAVVLFGQGCTAEVISEEGLILTNHHCGYPQIQQQSSVEHDYLTNGFWAMSRAEELPNPGLTVSFLVRMEDVTARVLADVKPGMKEAERAKLVNAAIIKIENEAIQGTHYEAKVNPLYYGNEYYLFVTEVFKDVRLVGAPQSGIGKFGGDTDNWMWPRHTGDFSVFRIYADKNNSPAAYSKDNVPYKPKKSLSLSIKPVNKGDFTMVYGFPARTSEYLTSYAIEMITLSDNPAKIKVRDKRLEIMGADMKIDRKVRIQYSSKYAGVANAWKKWIGEIKGLKKLDAITKKQQFEQQFTTWVNADAARMEQYAYLLPRFKQIYTEMTPIRLAYSYFAEAGMGIEALRFALGFTNLIKAANDKATNPEDLQKMADKLKYGIAAFYKDYNKDTDRKMCAAMLRLYNNGMDKNMLPSCFADIQNKYKGDFEKYSDEVFGKTIFADQQKVTSILNSFNPKSARKLASDPAYLLAISMREYFDANVKDKINKYEDEIALLMRTYMKAIREMQADKVFYPDANSTLRVAYGKVDDYSPQDGVRYGYYTTLDGIIEKEDSTIYDYTIPKRLKDLYYAKDYGRYGVNGQMPVCFIASNHTTGGNSGSPVLNDNGELIGLNFDRDWEGTMSDIMFDPNQCRNIMLDMHYFLFVVDKVAGAGHLVKEMKIVE